ncbi:hypothetical protein ACFQJD_14215 [Haloplanus sp. GCM10025708]
MCHYYGAAGWIDEYERRRDEGSAADEDEEETEYPTLVAPGDD